MRLLLPNFAFLLAYSTTIYLKKRYIWNQNSSFSASKTKPRQALMKIKYSNSLIFLFYSLFFLLLFLQLPINGNIAGNCDTWYVIAYSNAYLAKLTSFFTGAEIGSALYPIKDIYAYGESAIGTAIIFIFFKLLGCSDVWAFYGFITVLFSLTAFSIFLIAKLYVQQWWAALFAGLAFMCSSFTFGNIDSPHTVFFAPTFFAFYFVKLFLQKKHNYYLLIASILAGIQVYFSAYVFLFGTIVLGLLVLINWSVLRLKESIIYWALALVLFLLITVPFFNFYFSKMAQPIFYNPFDSVLLAEAHSLDPVDFTRSLSDNLLYAHQPMPSKTIKKNGDLLTDYGYTYAPIKDAKFMQGKQAKTTDEVRYVSARRTANIGILIYILAFIGLLMTIYKARLELAFIGLAGLFLAFGPVIIIGDFLLPSPTYPLYTMTSFFQVLRVPCRAFFLTLFSLSILAAYGLSYLSKYAQRKNFTLPPLLFVGLASILFMIENISFPLNAFEASKYQTVPTEYQELTKQSKKNTILILPSEVGIALGKDTESLCQYNREIIYMNWQNQHQQNILNGVNGYFPRNRLEVQKLIYQLRNNPGVVLSFAKDYAVSHVLFHKNMLVYSYEQEILSFLEKNPYLKQVKNTSNVAIFTIQTTSSTEKP